MSNSRKKGGSSERLALYSDCGRSSRVLMGAMGLPLDLDRSAEMDPQEEESRRVQEALAGEQGWLEKVLEAGRTCHEQQLRSARRAARRMGTRPKA